MNNPSLRKFFSSLLRRILWVKTAGIASFTLLIFILVNVLLAQDSNMDFIDSSNSIEVTEGDSLFENGNKTDKKSNVDLSGENLLKPEDDFLSFEKIRDDRFVNWVVFWLTNSILFVGIARFVFPVRFNETIQSSVNSRFFSLLEKESGIIGTTVNYLLYLNYLFVFTVVVYLSFKYFGIQVPLKNIHPILPFITFLSMGIVFSLLKLWMLNFTAWLFNTSRETITYIRNIIVVNEFTGVILLPLVFFHLINPFNPVLYAIWALFLLLLIYKVLRGAVLGFNHSRFSLYYLILYLCAVEIMPLLLLIKFSKSYFHI